MKRFKIGDTTVIDSNTDIYGRDVFPKDLIGKEAKIIDKDFEQIDHDDFDYVIQTLNSDYGYYCYDSNLR